MIDISLNLDTELTMRVNKFRRILKISSTLLKNVIALNNKFTKTKPFCIYNAHPLNLLKVAFGIKNFSKIFVTEYASFEGYNFIYKKNALIFYKRRKLLAVPTTLDSETYKSLGIQNEYLPNPLPFYPSQSGKLENKLALNIGRFTDDKQHILLLELWPQSRAIENGWKLKIIGKGENHEAIVDKIKKLNL